ncbi:ribonuclease J [Candidatus Woesearchaeota archaeon CG_4_10_14_0_8_um_filter_47_5]|nr:MAG: ribonuclease J [Candidatus Woesearchaeota archaeon CG_4_10_14_0_8_um_filter_47_5]
MIELCAVGGYTEIGRNMTAVRVGDDVVIFDMGLHVERYIQLKGDDDPRDLTVETLKNHDAIPDFSRIKDWEGMVRLIVPSHAHLDHIGAIPFIGPRYSCPVLCSPYTGAVLEKIYQDHKSRHLPKIKTMNVNTTYRLSKTLQVEFINVTHSTPQTVIAVLHTPEGSIAYANDFKLDNFPVLGKKTNMRRLKELGDSGVVNALIIDSTGALRPMKTPSESVALEMLKDVIMSTEFRNKAIVVTTFSSHIARLKSIVALARKINRKVLFLGRSLAKYTEAAQACGIINFSGEAEIIKYKSAIRRRLRKLEKEGNREQYLLVVTGHQGEPDAVLSAMAAGTLSFTFYPGDYVLFSCAVIPTPTTRKNRERLEGELQQKQVRIFRDLHVSGHASKEEHRDLISLLRPRHLIPAHGEPPMIAALGELATEMGYREGKTLHSLHEGERIRLT